MDEVYKTLINAVPWGVVIIILRWLDIKEKVEERRERDANAKDKAEQDRQTQITISSTYASAINSMNVVVDMSSKNIVKSMDEFRDVVLDQYRRMGITQNLRDLDQERRKGTD